MCESQIGLQASKGSMNVENVYKFCYTTWKIIVLLFI